MSSLKRLIFEVYNGIGPRDLQKSEYVIYAHAIDDEMYIGFSNDPVKRWVEHFQDAMSECSPNFDTLLKSAIRGTRFSNIRHLVLAVADTERLARRKEAEAIRFYKPRLNSGATLSTDHGEFGLKRLSGQSPTLVKVFKRQNPGTWRSRTDMDRVPALAEIIWERNRKRLMTVENEFFDAGYRVECSRAEREKFEVGAIVEVEVAESVKRSGGVYLVARKSDALVRVD